uniref:Uncharacterized protein n=1 Tax=Pristionchus pacificus TaxID=54126 RepID=A0A2A6CTA6_PRIPA|eukprot:PDM81338.1 hypothetical protein PRIPAC_36341 [Pristionchus pacificus]
MIMTSFHAIVEEANVICILEILEHLLRSISGDGTNSMTRAYGGSAVGGMGSFGHFAGGSFIHGAPFHHI